MWLLGPHVMEVAVSLLVGRIYVGSRAVVGGRDKVECFTSLKQSMEVAVDAA